MNVDRILETFNRHEVAWLLIGGMNFLLRHKPVLTFDVDLWVDDTVQNRLHFIFAGHFARDSWRSLSQR